MARRRASIPPATSAAPTAPPAPPIESGSPSDTRAAFSQLTQSTERNQEAERAFIANKWHILRTHPGIDPRMRGLVHAEFAARLAYGADVPPVPGGVGYGAFYSPAFKTSFTRGTSLYWHVICPTPPGGNVTTFLYVTAMNRAALGLEAFISYDGQEDTHFKVFDWARTDHWQTDVMFADLAAYVRNESVHGHIHQALPVWNSTYEISAPERAPGAVDVPTPPKTWWRNEALLYNFVDRRWDLIYRYDYAASQQEQKTGWTGSWGPIVETFQSFYENTEAFGTTTTMLTGEDAAGVWGSWHELDPADATIREDNVGFRLLFLDPNHRWAVRS